MALLTITINDPGLKQRSSEVAFAANAVHAALNEFQRARGNSGSGTILGNSATGVSNTSLGSWSYVTTASIP